ncbi:30S ribosomal protein S16 [bacterium]|nr:30S ribosomal protein S16 [bacterium]
MSVRIRLRKISRTDKGRYNFRIVVTDRRDARDSRPVEEIGYYGPSKNPASLIFKKERYDYWISKGAQPTETVASLFKEFNKKQIKT